MVLFSRLLVFKLGLYILAFDLSRQDGRVRRLFLLALSPGVAEGYRGGSWKLTDCQLNFVAPLRPIEARAIRKVIKKRQACFFALSNILQFAQSRCLSGI